MVSDTTSHYYFHSTQNQPGREGSLTAYAIGEKADVLYHPSSLRILPVLTLYTLYFYSQEPSLSLFISPYPFHLY